MTKKETLKIAVIGGLIVGAIIIFVFTPLYDWIWGSESVENPINTTFIDNFINFWTFEIELWISVCVSSIIIIFLLTTRNKSKSNILKKKSFKKYLGVYEVLHYVPHSVGSPKLSTAFLILKNSNITYLHSLFKCENGWVEQMDGHIFINLNNREKENAPYYFIVNCVNDSVIEFLGGISVGIGQRQNSHPIAVKVCFKKREDLETYTQDQIYQLCTFTEITPEILKSEEFSPIIKEFLWNKCNNKDILF